MGALKNFGKWLTKDLKAQPYNPKPGIFRPANPSKLHNWLAGGGAADALKVGQVAVGTLIGGAVLVPVVGGGSVLTGGGKKMGFLSDLFKKKEGGTILGNLVRTAVPKLVDVVADEIKTTTHNLVERQVSSGGSTISDPILSAAVTGAKSGAVSGWIKQHIGVLIVGAIGLVFIFSLIFHKRR